MQTINFHELVPGMVVCPKEFATGDEFHPYHTMILSGIVREEDNSVVWNGGRALNFLSVESPEQGICSTNYGTDDDFEWVVVDDQATLENIRATVKNEINKFRDHLDECERLVDRNV